MDGQGCQDREQTQSRTQATTKRTPGWSSDRDPFRSRTQGIDCPEDAIEWHRRVAGSGCVPAGEYVPAVARNHPVGYQARLSKKGDNDAGPAGDAGSTLDADVDAVGKGGAHTGAPDLGLEDAFGPLEQS
jgi:hypothetical protein